MLTIEQQRKAVNYTLLFLRDEIESIKKSIKECKHEDSKRLLIQRLRELEKDQEMFEEIGDRI